MPIKDYHTNISTSSTTVSTTTPSNITRMVSFKIIWMELDSPGETTDGLKCFSACKNRNLCQEQRQDKFEICKIDDLFEDSRNFYF